MRNSLIFWALLAVPLWLSSHHASATIPLDNQDIYVGIIAPDPELETKLSRLLEEVGLSEEIEITAISKSSTPEKPRLVFHFALKTRDEIIAETGKHYKRLSAFEFPSSTGRMPVSQLNIWTKLFMLISAVSGVDPESIEGRKFGSDFKGDKCIYTVTLSKGDVENE